MVAGTPDPADATAGRELVEGVRIARAVQVATQLGIPDLLADGPRSTADLAEATSTHEGALYRLLRALANRDLFEEVDDGFALTARGRLLRADVPGSLRGWTLWHGSEWSLRAWAAFEHSVRTGEPAFAQAFGAPFFEYLAAHPAMASMFGAAMVSISGQMDVAVADAVDFGQFKVVADIGGGQGALLALLLRRHAGLRGILMDLPRVVASAPALLSEAGVEARVSIVGGDFFTEVPTGADAYVLKAILHDWRDDEATAILRRCRAAMSDPARLLIAGMVVPDRGTPSPIKEMDLQMLAMQTGRERTVEELERLLDEAGFDLLEVRPTASPLSLTVAAPK